MIYRIAGCAILGVALLAGCQGWRPTAWGAASPIVVGEVGGEPVTLEDLDAHIKEELWSKRTDGGKPSCIYELREKALDGLLAERAVEQAAERRGMTVDEMLTAEGEALGPVTDEQVEAFLSANQSRLPDLPMEQIAAEVRRHLEQQRPQTAAAAIVAAAEIQKLLEPYRLEISSDGPSKGPDAAPVTIVEFSDFQCPYCQRATPVLDKIMARYPDEVRVVYRHMPLDFHPRARAAAEASACVDEQGAFWPFHDRLFENPKALSDDDFQRYAGEVGADVAALDACLASARPAARVTADIAAAREVGVTGTPAFVVNGILISGLQPPEAFDRLIQAELVRADALP